MKEEAKVDTKKPNKMLAAVTKSLAEKALKANTPVQTVKVPGKAKTEQLFPNKLPPLYKG